MPNLNIAVIGASGGIGSTFVRLLSDDQTNSVHAFSRSYIKNESPNVHLGKIDFADEESISTAAAEAAKHAPLDLVIVAAGLLHDTTMTLKSRGFHYA